MAWWLFTLTVPFILSLLIGAVYVILHPGIHWESGSIMTLLLLLAASIIYISAFYLIGLLVSSRTAHSSISILVSLFIWVFFHSDHSKHQPVYRRTDLQRPIIDKI